MIKEKENRPVTNRFQHLQVRAGVQVRGGLGKGMLRDAFRIMVNLSVSEASTQLAPFTAGQLFWGPARHPLRRQFVYLGTERHGSSASPPFVFQEKKCQCSFENGY